MYESAAEAASPASFQPLNAHTITGARSSGRSRQITSVINLTVPDVRSAITIEAVTIAELRAGGEVEGVFACTRKDRLTAKNGSPYLAVELRDRTGAIPGRAFRDADFLAGQFERGDLVARERARGALPRRAPGGAEDHQARAEEAPDPPSSCRWPTATWRSSTASSSTSRARSTTPTSAPCSTPSSATRRFRAELPARPLHALRPPRLPRRAARAHGGGGDARLRDLHAPPAAQLRPAPERGDPARRGQDARVRARGAEIALSEAGALVGH